MELFAPANLGANVASMLRAPLHKPPDVSRVKETETSGKTGADTRHLSQNTENSALARGLKALHQSQKDPDRPAGPPPSFEVSLLEVEQNLKEVIARMEISRGQKRDADAVRSGGEDETRPATSAQESDRTTQNSSKVAETDIL